MMAQCRERYVSVDPLLFNPDLKNIINDNHANGFNDEVFVV